LLQGETLGLWDKEVGIDKGGSVEGSPDEEHLGAKVTLVLTDHVRGNDGNDAVPQPVRGGGETDTTGSDRNGEDLANDNPCTGAPGGGKEEDVDADEGNQCSGSAWVVGKGSSDSTDDELTDDHAQGTPDEKRATSKALNGPERDGGGDDVHDGEDHGHEEWVLDGVERLEENGGVVKDEVDTGPLLHHLQRCTQNRTAQVG